VTDFDSHLLSSGSATWTTSLLPGGTYNVTAHYPGDGNYSSSDSATSVPVVVNKENSTIALGLVTFDFNGNLLSSGATTATYGSLYILRVGVTGTTCSSNSQGQAGCPTGSVSLIDNGSPLGAGTYALNNLGYAEDQAIQLPGGSHAMQATYAGDNSFNGNSASDPLTITPAATSVQDVVPPGWITVNSPFGITTGISSESSGVAPTGTFTFYADGKQLMGASSTSPVAPCGNNSYVCLNANLSGAVVSTPGLHTISVTYNGDSNYAPSSLSASVSAFYLTTTTLTATPQNPQPATSVTLTALIDTPEKGLTPTGTVSFNEVTASISAGIPGPVTLTPATDAGGNSALLATLTFMPSANNTMVSAAYSGDSNFQQSGSGYTTTITVAGSDFAFYAGYPTAVVPTPGVNTSMGLTIDGEAAYNGTITFAPSACSGLPAESSCSFSPSSVVGSGGTTVFINTTAPHAIRGTQARSRQNPVLWWSMTASGMLGLLLAGTPLRRHGYRLLPLLLVAFLLVLPGCGGGSSGGGGGGSGGPTDPGTPVGTYTVTVTATSGSLTHKASFQLVVQ